MMPICRTAMAKNSGITFEGYCRLPRRIRFSCILCSEINGFTSLREDIEKAKIIREGDFQANYAYYCLHRLGILPSQFMTMSQKEKAFVIGAIDLKLEKEGR